MSTDDGGVTPSLDEPRNTQLWREWLRSMATNPEAALAAAIAYREMDDAGRMRWLESLRTDVDELDVPAVAVYAPLLAVESNEERRDLLKLGLNVDEASLPSQEPWALGARSDPESKLILLVIPLYLDFVQILACTIQRGTFSAVRHDPIALATAVPAPNELFDGARLERVPLKSALDDIASTILSHRRTGAAIPDALHVVSDLLTLDGC
ncbi:MAG: hypothetical protein MK135_12625 [Polyangiaceae bacterium]|nr:hypothetical protein [Polyangiaceae bacterium]